MAIKKEVHVTIAPDGMVTLETHGFKSAECEEELKSVEKSVGLVKSRARTKEYYESATKTRHIKDTSTK